MSGTFTIDALPERAAAYRGSHAIVAVDVFRATTTILTALATGRRVFPMPDIESAREASRRIAGALLAGEQGGEKPPGFELQNSPVALARMQDRRPVILLTSGGTRLLSEAVGAEAVYAACLRNLSATADHLARNHPRIALIGAGARGAARPEDQIACAAIGRALAARGFAAEGDRTRLELSRWRAVDPDEIRASPSGEYLRRTGQAEDIEFVLAYVDDLDEVAEFDGHEVTLREVSQPPARVVSL